MPRRRLDTLLVERGLAASRDRARALILAGEVHVAGLAVPKAGALVADDADVVVRVPDHPWVGRGGLKLAHALEAFSVTVDGRDALDVGASTGGFTDVLLARGARSVVALDVGHGQLDWRLRHDPRVVVLERTNARTLTSDRLPEAHRDFDVVTVDVSFISLRLVLPPLVTLLRPGADLVVLVKPQFEAGRHEVGAGGIVRDPDVHRRVVDDIADVSRRLGLRVMASTPSPVTGADGNREFLLHLRGEGPCP
ncbi:MAG: TlyA family RNA methyltransferase [Acidobacteria bacterium]|nr:TlyA family RNA methyltransferase [Acidobacteriota bacterium]